MMYVAEEDFYQFGYCWVYLPGEYGDCLLPFSLYSRQSWLEYWWY